ncbi:MAG: M48 family metallopeptidase [Actinomycetota bacterium]|nr:M48 family metallopeptidase [Actinomycetota bacterium]
MQVEVVRSARRKKTVSARELGGVLQVSIPATMTKAEEQHWVAEMIRRTDRRRSAGSIDLAARARLLADRYDLSPPRSIRWSENQQWRWGSCTPSDGSVRISSRLAGEPGWVLDYVIIHELAHLHIAGHDARFWTLVRRYPRAELARGFLMARSLRGADDDPAVSASEAEEAHDSWFDDAPTPEPTPGRPAAVTTSSPDLSVRRW